MKHNLNGLIQTGANTIEGKYRMHPARFWYNNKEYEHYDNYPTRKLALASIKGLKSRSFATKMVKLHGYINLNDIVYAVYASDLKYKV